MIINCSQCLLQLQVSKRSALEKFIHNVNSSLKKNGINTDWLQIKEVLSESVPGEKKEGKKEHKNQMLKSELKQVSSSCWFPNLIKKFGNQIPVGNMNCL